MREYSANREGNPIAAKSEETLAGEDVTNIATSDDDYEEGNESISPDTSYSAGMHTSGDDTYGEYDPSQESPLERVDRIMESLRTASAEEEPILFAGLEVVTTFTKPKKVHYREDSDCGLYSDGSDDTEDEYNPHEGMRNSSA